MVMLEGNPVHKINTMGIQLLRRYSSLNLTLFDQAVVSGVNFLTGILLARYLGAEEFGRFTLLWMSVLFLNSLQTALIISPMMSIGPKQKSDESSEYFGTVFVHQLLFATFTTIVLFSAIFTLSLIFPSWQIQGFAFPIMSVNFTCQLQEYLRKYYFTHHRHRDAFINDLISYLGQLIGLIYLFKTSSHVTVENVLWIISLTSALAIGYGLMMGNLALHKQQFSEVFERHWNFSKWLTASTLMQWASGNLLLITAGTILGPTSAGILKACQNILGVTHILFNALANIAPVQASKLLHEQGFSHMQNYLLKAVLFGGISTFILAIPALVFPNQTLLWIYGKDFSGYGWILFIYALVYLIMFLNQMLTFGLRTLEETKPIFTGYLFTSIISILTAYPLVKAFRLNGVVFGLLLLALINFLLLFLGYQKRREKPGTPNI